MQIPKENPRSLLPKSKGLGKKKELELRAKQDPFEVG